MLACGFVVVAVGGMVFVTVDAAVLVISGVVVVMGVAVAMSNGTEMFFSISIVWTFTITILSTTDLFTGGALLMSSRVKLCPEGSLSKSSCERFARSFLYSFHNRDGSMATAARLVLRNDLFTSGVKIPEMPTLRTDLLPTRTWLLSSCATRSGLAFDSSSVLLRRSGSLSRLYLEIGSFSTFPSSSLALTRAHWLSVDGLSIAIRIQLHKPSSTILQSMVHSAEFNKL